MSGLSPRRDGAFVLYWMRDALRGHENPALDTAIALANASGCPLLVYHGLAERYDHAADRHHHFALEASVDVADELARRGIPYALHVARPGHRGPWLAQLAAEAVVVISEDVPVDPALSFTRRMVTACPQTPLWLVDCACVLPMALVGRAFDRAFAFRDRTQTERQERLHRDWPEIAYHGPNRAPPLPFTPVDPRTADLDALVAAQEIDHAVPPVADTIGGARAGYRRWQAFRGNGGLDAYARLRNDAAVVGVSRMSPYLRWGMVSPFRLAREAAAHGGASADKWLDEFLIWRELAWCFCRFTANPTVTDAVPGWARAALAAAELDPRPYLLGREALARARSGEALWDAAQRCLLKHGELHNNLRMTWGKALIDWTPNLATALAHSVWLNDRYALDGRDPASYGGILWCFGLFDRPHAPAMPILGTVRPRSLESHARRLDMPAWLAIADRPPRGPAASVAVVGAGIAGLACARVLADHGHTVRLFDKGRGAGGRVATRRGPWGAADHGAPRFAARDRRFIEAVEDWAEIGLVHPCPETAGAWVARPWMSALGRHLARDLALDNGVTIASARHAADGWHISDAAGASFGPFDRLVVAVPPAQAGRLLADAPDLAALAAAAAMAPCWTAILAFADPALPEGSVAVERVGGLARLACRTGADGARVVVAQATAEWSAAHLELSPEAALPELVALVDKAVGRPLPTPIFATTHRWRYAEVARVAPAGHRWNAERGVGICGDWTEASGVEGAWLSGVALAGRIMTAQLEPARTVRP
jgi:hypothetical protein